MFTRNTSFKLKLIDLSDNTTVTAAGTNTQTLQPPSGKIYEIIDIQYYAADPIGSSSGTHTITIYNAGLSSDSWSKKIIVAGTTGNAIMLGYGGEFTGNSQENPGAATDQIRMLMMGLLWASYTYTITFIYANATDVSQTGTRTCKVLVKEYNEVG